MKALVLEEPKTPLIFKEIEKPQISQSQLLIQVHSCAVCRTDLHIIDGELKHPNLPLILGHQIVGTVIKVGSQTSKFKQGDKVGVPWLGSTCQKCYFCHNGQENLCDFAKFTGYDFQGGFAEFCTAEEAFCFALPDRFDNIHIAPMLCGGLIGYRAYKKAPHAKKIGFYGFGSSAHILTQLATYEKKEIYAFTKEGDLQGKLFAKRLGAVWAGSSNDSPLYPLDAAIIFAPVGALIPKALQDVRKGGIVISAGIHMSPIPSFSYDLLWEERTVTSVANLTHQDGLDFFKAIEPIPLDIEVTVFPLQQGNEAIDALRKGSKKGSIVLNCDLFGR